MSNELEALPKDIWIPAEQFHECCLSMAVISGERRIFDTDNLMDPVEKFLCERDIFYELEKRRILVGDLDLEMGIKKDLKGKPYEVVKSLRFLGETHNNLGSSLPDKPSHKIFIESNLSLSLPPEMDHVKLCGLVRYLSFHGLNKLLIDKDTIFRFKDDGFGANQACEYLEKLLDEPLSEPVKSYLSKHLGGMGQVVKMYEENDCLVLSDPAMLPDVLSLLDSSSIVDIIDNKVILLNGYVSISTLKSKLKTRRIVFKNFELG